MFVVWFFRDLVVVVDFVGKVVDDMGIVLGERIVRLF